MLGTRSAALAAGAPAPQAQPTPYTPAELIALGYVPIPIDGKIPSRKAWQTRTFAPGDWLPGEGVGLRMGEQEQTGLYLYCLDLDSRTEQQNADQFLRRIMRQLPRTLAARLFTARSTGGAGRYIMFLCRVELPNGLLFNRKGIRAGEFLGDGRHVVCPAPERWLQNKLTGLSILDDQDLDLLLGACGYRPSCKSGDTEPIEVSDKQIAYWTRNLDRLIGAHGYPNRLKRHSQTYRTLAGTYTSGDASQDRYNVIHGLLMHRYGPARTAALALHFCAWNRSGRALYDDVLRCIDKVIDQHPEYLSEGDREQPIERPAPRPAGRPAAYTPETYLDTLRGLIDAGDLVLLTRKERAQALGCSVATVDRVERVLLSEGKIERGTSRDRARSWVRVLGAIKTPAPSTQNHADPVLSDDPAARPVRSTAKPQSVRGACTPLEGTRLLSNPPAAPATAPSPAGWHTPPCPFPTEREPSTGPALPLNLLGDPTLAPAPEQPAPKRARQTLPKNPTIADIPQFERARARALKRVIWLKQIGSLSEARAVERQVRHKHDPVLARLYTERNQLAPRLLDYSPSDSGSEQPGHAQQGTAMPQTTIAPTPKTPKKPDQNMHAIPVRHRLTLDKPGPQAEAVAASAAGAGAVDAFDHAQPEKREGGSTGGAGAVGATEAQPRRTLDRVYFARCIDNAERYPARRDQELAAAQRHVMLYGAGLTFEQACAAVGINGVQD
jgi:hypothetical protein